jgi:hypothetical protein
MQNSLYNGIVSASSCTVPMTSKFSGAASWEAISRSGESFTRGRRHKVRDPRNSLQLFATLRLSVKASSATSSAQSFVLYSDTTLINMATRAVGTWRSLPLELG